MAEANVDGSRDRLHDLVVPAGKEYVAAALLTAVVEVVGGEIDCVTGIFVLDGFGDTPLDIQPFGRVEIVVGDGPVECGAKRFVAVGGVLTSGLDQFGDLRLDAVECAGRTSAAVGAVDDGVVIESLGRDALGRGQGGDGVVRHPVNPGCAEFHRNTPGPIRMDAATQAIPRLEHDDATAGGDEYLGGSQSGDAGADDEHVGVPFGGRRRRGRGRG